MLVLRLYSTERITCASRRRPQNVSELFEFYQALLLSDARPKLSANHQEWTESSSWGTLRLRMAFGGWGTMVNPTGMAVDETLGQIVVVHDAVFSERLLNAFGWLSNVCYTLDVALTKTGHVLVTDAATVQCFRLPWGVDVDNRGRVFVTDAQMGSLRPNLVVLKELTHPRSVASCRASGNIAIMERLQSSFTLRMFNSDFVPLAQVDGFSLHLKNALSLVISAVAFDRNGDVIVGDVLVVLDGGDHAVKFYTADAEDLYRDK
uniref:Uncharacterized protein n=1 Tax=Sinocyclocheilus rhinocerous TaxID=307959 RepID=A0A673GTL8_9TELE